MAFRLVAADLDGTLRAEGQDFTPRVREAVRCAQSKGVRVVMATGRMYRTARPFALDLGLTAPIICDHGATIRDLAGAVLFEQHMPPELARQVIEAAPEGATLLACVGEEFYTARRTRDAESFVGKFAAEHLHGVEDWDAVLKQGTQKLVFVNDPVLTSRLLVDLTSQFGERLQVVQSFPRYVELTHRGVSKGKAVAWLAEHWGIPREQVIAIGDQGNDISMIEWAGLGVAMGNAVERVKGAAHYVTSTAEEDGVAEVIERFVLSSDQNEDTDIARERY